MQCSRPNPQRQCSLRLIEFQAFPVTVGARRSSCMHLEQPLQRAGIHKADAKTTSVDYTSQLKVSISKRTSRDDRTIEMAALSEL